MNVDFTETHLDTLCELKALAEKHNCSIRFGVYNSSGFVSYEKFIGYSENIIEELQNRGVFYTDTEQGLNYSIQTMQNAIITVWGI